MKKGTNLNIQMVGSLLHKSEALQGMIDNYQSCCKKVQDDIIFHPEIKNILIANLTKIHANNVEFLLSDRTNHLFD